MDIYLDVLIILNTYLSWILINLTAAISNCALRPINCAIASFIGGISSLIILLPDDVKYICFTAFLLKAVSCAAIILAAFFGKNIKKLVSLTAIFIILSMVFCGAVRLISGILSIPQIAFTSGFIYLDISPVTLVLTSAAVYALLLIFGKIYDKTLGKNNRYRVEFRIGCKAFSLDAYADTGNNVRDLFSGLPVIICTGIEIKDGRNIRAVPYKTVSGEGILYAFKPDEITVSAEGESPKKVSALVASADESGAKKAIFNPSILA